jgi:uncharacterized protein YjbJ (UPF0337 family)
MDWNRVEGSWKQTSGKIKEKWGKLTDDDLTQINGKREQLEGKIQERYGIAKDHVRNDVDTWLNSLDWGKATCESLDILLRGFPFADWNCAGVRQVSNAERLVARTKMNRHDRELLDRQMSHLQPAPRRDGILIFAMAGVFIAGLTAGGLLFTLGSKPFTSTALDDGRTALAFLLNGTANTARQ